MTSIISVILSILSLVLTFFGYPGFPTGDDVDMNKFELTWSDEFEGTKVNSKNWCRGWYPSTKTSTRKGGYWNTRLATVKDGALHIATRYYENGLDGGPAGWYTTQISTQGKFEQKYGYFEVCCKLPKGAGIWSAFWMMCDGVGIVDGSGRDGTEIDIFESPFYTVSNKKNCIQSALHYDGYDEDHQQETVHTTHVYGKDPYETFNTYGLEWNEAEYIFYINGVECARSDFGGVSQVPEYLILSVEIGGENGIPADSWCGDSITTNTDEITDFVVDYVRVYQYK